MSAQIILVEPSIAQAPDPNQEGNLLQTPLPWMIASGVFLVAIAGLIVFGQFKFKKFAKEKRFEEFKNRELQKKLRLALQTISKMERNPDLIHSREFNLDYLRMRMDEAQFQFAIINQLKIKVKEKISVALRSSPGKDTGVVGIASTGRNIDEIFDVEYNLTHSPKPVTRVLFRVQIKLTKLPTQPTSVTITQIIDCLQRFMSPEAEDNHWQPVIQNRIANLHWDQKAKPTPLLVLEQLNEGVNVTYRTNPMAPKRPGESDASNPTSPPNPNTRKSRSKSDSPSSHPTSPPNPNTRKSRSNGHRSKSNRPAPR